MTARTTILTAGAALATTVALSGCAEQPDSSSSGTQQIAFLQLAAAGYTNGLRDGVEAAGAEAGYDVTTFDATSDPQKQVTQCQDAVATGQYAGLVIEPVDGTTLAGCVATAEAAGVEVVAVESAIGPNPSSTEIQVDGVSAQVVLLPEDLARGSAQMTIEACAGIDPCEVAYSIADPAAQILVEQRDLTVEALEQATNITVVAEVTGGYDNPGQGRSVAQTTYQNYPDLSVIVGDDDVTMEGINQWVIDEGLQGQVRTVGNGATKVSTAAIRAGEQYGANILFPRSAAQRATELLIAVIEGDSEGPAELSWGDISPLGKGQFALTADNVDEFEPEF